MNGSKLVFDSAVTESEARLFVRIIQIVVTAVSTATRVHQVEVLRFQTQPNIAPSPALPYFK